MFDEIAPNLFRIQVKSKFSLLKAPVNLYLFAGEDGLLWDAGYGKRKDVQSVARDLRKISALMHGRGQACKVSRILVSHGHSDHFSGLSALRQITGAKAVLTSKVAARITSAEIYRKSWEEHPKALRPLLPVLLRVLFAALVWFQEKLFGTQWVPDPDIIMSDSGTLRAGGRILRYFPIPGHADDHLALYCPAEGILMSGDHILRSITSWMGPPKSNIEDYERSLQTLMELSPLKRIFPAHGSPIEEPQKRLQAALSHSQRRTQKVLKAVSDAGFRGISFYALLKKIYPLAPASTRLGADGWVLLTLRMLLEKGEIKAEKQRGQWRFRV